MTHKENIRAILECHFAGFKEEIIDSACNRILEQEIRQYEVKAVTRGNCMMCGKELTDGLFFCEECEDKGE